MQLMQCFVVFAMSAFLATLLTPWCKWGCCGSICLLGYERTFFLQSLALPRAVQGPCERRKITVSTNNRLHVHGLVHNMLLLFFTLGSSKIEKMNLFF